MRRVSINTRVSVSQIHHMWQVKTLIPRDYVIVVKGHGVANRILGGVSDWPDQLGKHDSSDHPPVDPHPTPHPDPYISVPHKEFLIFTIPSHKKEVPNLFYPPPYKSTPKFFVCVTFAYMHNSIAADQLLRELAISIARNSVGAMRPLAEVLAAEGLTQTEYDAIAVNPMFQRYVDAFSKEFRESGYSLQAKARILVEDLMASLYHDVKDKDLPLAARAKVFDTMVSIADAIPKTNQNVVAGPGFSITFNLNGGAQTIAKGVTEVEDVVEITTEKLESAENTVDFHVPTTFAEPDDYEYAGDDHI